MDETQHPGADVVGWRQLPDGTQRFWDGKEWIGDPRVPTKEWDWVSIVGFVFAVIGGSLIGLIMGVIGVRRTQAGSRRGRGLAIAAIIVSLLWIIVVIGIIIAVSAWSPGRDATGTVTEPGTEFVEDLKVGDCLKEVQETTEMITTTPVVPCSEPHKGQVFAVFNLPDGKYPNDAALETLATQGCSDHAPEALKNDAEAASLDLLYLHPTPASWNTGDREVTCIAVAHDSETMHGNLAGL